MDDSIPLAETEVARQKLRLYFRSAIAAQVAFVVVGGILVFYLGGLTPPPWALGWWFLVSVIALSRLWLARGFLAIPEPIQDIATWQRYAVGGAAVAGMAWALGGVAMMVSDPGETRVFFAMMMAGIASGAVATLSALPSAFRAFVIPITLVIVLTALLDAHGVHDVVLAFSVLLLLVILMRSAHLFHDSLDASIRMALRMRLLADQLDASRRESEGIASTLREAKAAAEAATIAKSDFLANMSHEIRTPLNAVLGLAKIGMRDGHESRMVSLFDRILDSGSHLLGVVNDILDFSKIEAGKLKVETRPFALFSIIDDVRSFVAMRAEEKGLRLTVSLAPDLSDWVEGDSFRLTQILTNLLSNAIKFTPQGEVLLRVARDGDKLVFMVADEGIGMSEEQLARLFQPFEQADSSTTRSYGGTGLGLAVSRQLACLMGGDIAVDSRPGAGSSFYLQVPMPAVAAPTHEGRPAGTPIQAGSRLKGLSVLAADDVDLNRFILEDLLTHEGAHVFTAADGQQALDMIEERGVSAFDVVLMDVQMPVMDGLEATRRLVRMAPALPVIGLTAHAMAEERSRCLAAGMVDHVTKPVDTDALVAAIRRQVRIPTQPESDSAPPMATVATVATMAADAPERLAFPGCDDPEIIELSVLGDRIGNDPAKIAKYANRFIEHARPDVAEMQQAAAAGDLPKLAAVAHRLKSTALAVGAMRFGSICGELQLLKAGDDPLPARAQVAHLRELFEQITQRIEDAFREGR